MKNVNDERGLIVLVPTPIGNLGDITLRALEWLKKAQHIVAEDTRRTRKLLSHFEIDAGKLSRLDANASEADLARVIAWVEDAKTVAVCTDAGAPGISDPGTHLVRAAVAKGLDVTALPGPSAVTVAVSLSGFVDQAFCFYGFLPRGSVERAEKIAALAATPDPCVLFEAPQRCADTLKELAEVMPDRMVAVARELTKLHEEVLRGSLCDIAKVEREWLGEITLVLGAFVRDKSCLPTDAEVDARIDEALATGLHTRTVAERVAAWSGRHKRTVYERVLERKGK